MLMAETRRYIPDHTINIEQILEEAKHRWLRPTEILEILRNYQKFKLTAEPPARPAAGSMFLFDRKALRYFRKDGHRWRKKKDGKTVREAHEKLKAGSVDVLHCYYAHGEDNENFQRRCYWMLDGQLEHIVFVHYREVKEGNKSGVSRLLEDSGTQVENLQPSPVTSFAQAASPASTVQTSYASSPNRIDWNGKALSSEFEDVDSRNGPGTSSLAQSIHGSMSHNSSLLSPRVEGFHVLPKNPPGSWLAGAKFDLGTQSSLLPEISSSERSVSRLPGQKFFVDQPGGAEFITNKLTGATLEGIAVPDTVVSATGLITDRTATPQNVIQELDFNLISPQLHNLSGTQTVAASTAQVENKANDGGANNIESGELKKLDSFGRWMDKEIGGDCDDSLMASDSGNYWSTLSAENEDKEVSSLSHHMQLDTDSLGPSLSQDQLFSIRDFSPDWAYAGVDTKVLIIGTFLGSKKFSSETKWGCMFGEIEVSAEVLNDCVIRCQVPQHAPGRVPFYITCCNRLSCSEVREFEYRENPFGTASLPAESAQQEEILFQMRLSKLLYLGPGMKSSNCSIEDCERCKIRSTLFSVSSLSLGRADQLVPLLLYIKDGTGCILIYLGNKRREQIAERSGAMEPATLGKSLAVPCVQELAKESPATVPTRYLRLDQDPPIINNNEVASLPQIPVIDMRRLVSEEQMDLELDKMDRACKEWGFFQLTNHGVDDSLVNKVKEGIQELFNLPMEEKSKYWQRPEEMEGFGQAFVVSEEQKLDWGDIFYMITLPKHARKPHLFPMLPQPLRDTLEAYSAELKNLAMKILYLMAKALRMKPDEIKDMFEEGSQMMRMNYYPPCPQPELVMGLNSHSDAVGLTILLQVSEVEGLQIRKSGKWIPVQPLPNAFVINIGDMLEIVTNGIYRSTEHRATVNSEKERISVATFYCLNLDGELGPAPSLVTPETPAAYRRMIVADFLKGFLSRELVGKSYVDVMRIQNGGDKDN